MIPAPLAAMAAYRQWLNWIPVPRPDGKVDKLPVSPHTREVCNAHTEDAQGTYEQAVSTGMGIAFAFRDTDPFGFVDIDGCKDANGQWTQTAQYICGLFPGCAVEVSQSGKGLHIFFTLPAGSPGHSTVSDALGTQFYTSRRFAALTFDGIQGDCTASPDPEVFTGFLNTYFPVRAETYGADWTDKPRGDWDGPEDDTELVARMRKSRSAKAILGGVTMAQLLDMDEDALSVAYPDTGGQGRAFDWSAADAAVAAQLAFWTGCNCERMRRIWGMLPLGNRDKFNDREDYVRDTILKACGICKKVYRQKRPAPDPTPVMPGQAPTGGVRDGFQLLDPTAQLEYFKGCIYVTDAHKAYIPGGELLKPEQFKARFGGYVFSLDAIGDKVTRNAWDAFTESQALTAPYAHGTCFKPDLPPGYVTERDGLRFVNMFEPIETPRADGDPGPFLDLLSRMIPDVDDRGILLAYLAAVVQYPGHKFYWCPLIQGEQGNGKSFINEALREAVGLRYYHEIEASDISSKFNAWVSTTILATIEEIHIQRNDLDAMTVLKKLVTNRIVPIQSKGKDQSVGENCVKLLLNSNFKDAVAKTENDRRFATFYTAQQCPEDFRRSGLDGDYFPNLYAWARGGGFAVINSFLRKYQIPDELNPAGACHRAPRTSTTAEAVAYNRGPIEQRVLEAVDEGRAGFCGGWISSMALDRLIADNRGNVALNKRTEMLRALGYYPHPGLPRGRVNNPILIEGGKPRLYLTAGHIAANETRGAEIARMYCEAQGYQVGDALPAALKGEK